MFKEKLEKQLGFKLPDKVFKQSLEMATNVIKKSRIAFKKRTTLKQALDITAICAMTALRYA